MTNLLLILSLFLQAPAFPAGERGVVTGLIRSSDGQPLTGISVLVMFGGIQDGRTRLTPLGISIPNTLTRTDGAGRYRLENIPPGRYYILAQSRGAESDLATLYPGVTDLRAAKRVDIRAGSEINGIDFSIVRGRAMKVRGRVFDAIAGGPSVLATVNLTGGLFASFRTSVDANGAFEFAGVPPGDYVLWAAETSRGAGERFATRRIIIESDVAGVELTFRPALSVKGRLILEDGRVFTNPRGLPGVTANIAEGTLGRGTNVFMDGSFTLGGRIGLIEGEYRISVDQLPEDYYVKSISFGSTDLLKETLKVSGPSTEEVAITLGVGTRIAGNVVDENQQPAANVRVYLVPRNPTGGQSDLPRAVQTDQNGDFVIRGVAPGTYTAFAVARFFPGAEQDPEFTREYETLGTVITASLGPHGPYSLRLVK